MCMWIKKAYLSVHLPHQCRKYKQQKKTQTHKIIRELWSPHLWSYWYLNYLLRQNVALILLVLHKNLPSLLSRYIGLDWYSTVKPVVRAWWCRLLCNFHESEYNYLRLKTPMKRLSYHHPSNMVAKVSLNLFELCQFHLKCSTTKWRISFFLLPMSLTCLKWILFSRPLVFKDISRSHWKICFWETF